MSLEVTDPESDTEACHACPEKASVQIEARHDPTSPYGTQIALCEGHTAALLELLLVREPTGQP